MRRVVVAASLLLMLVCAGRAGAAVVLREPGVRSLYALDGTLLYAVAQAENEAGRLMRLVDGERRRASRFPSRGRISSIGRDERGRVVVVVGDERSGWRMYDVAGDRVRPLRIATRATCAVTGAAVSRTQVAWVERCGRRAAVAVRTAGRTRRFRGIGGDEASLVLRDGSLIVQANQAPRMIWRVLDRGRACPYLVTAAGENYAQWPAVASGSLIWTSGSYDFHGHYVDVHVSDIDLSGRCQAAPKERFLRAIPNRPRAARVAMDGRRLYYATDRAVYAERLQRRGSTAPPPNDDFEDATPLAGDLPVRDGVRIGYATRERGEPLERSFKRTVWFRFTPAYDHALLVSPGRRAEVRVFTGRTLATLSPVPGTSRWPAVAFDARPGETYWFVLAGRGDAPSFDFSSIKVELWGPP